MASQQYQRPDQQDAGMKNRSTGTQDSKQASSTPPQSGRSTDASQGKTGRGDDRTRESSADSKVKSQQR